MSSPTKSYIYILYRTVKNTTITHHSYSNCTNLWSHTKPET